MKTKCAESWCYARVVKGVSRCKTHACRKRGCDERPLTGRDECKGHAGHAWKGLDRLAQETASALAVVEAPTVITRGGLTIRLLRETDAPAILAALDRIERDSKRRARKLVAV